MAEPTAPKQESDLRPVLLLCDRLSALLGTATTSALLRRALAQLSPLSPALASVRIEREGPSFACDVENPPPGDHTSELRTLGRSLSAILRELTGLAVIRYLATDPELAVFGFSEASQ
jgi:hypothetical protein